MKQSSFGSPQFAVCSGSSAEAGFEQGPRLLEASYPYLCKNLAQDVLKDLARQTSVSLLVSSWRNTRNRLRIGDIQLVEVALISGLQQPSRPEQQQQVLAAQGTQAPACSPEKRRKYVRQAIWEAQGGRRPDWAPTHLQLWGRRWQQSEFRS